MSVANVLSVYDRATDEAYAAGIHWYDRAHALALELTPGDIWKGAGILAAFSPQKKWKQNVKLARSAVETGNAHGSTMLFNGWAQRILDGEHTLDVLKSPKVRAFAQTIATGNSDWAVIDVHAQDIHYGRRRTEKQRPSISKAGRYMRISDAFIEASNLAGIPVAHMQAITWVQWQIDHDFPWANTWE